MTTRTLRAAALLAGTVALAACGPGQADQPQGQPTAPDLQTPVPQQSGFPADPVIPEPHETIHTNPPAPPPSALPT